MLNVIICYQTSICGYILLKKKYMKLNHIDFENRVYLSSLNTSIIVMHYK